MTKKQKLEMEQSEKRQALNVLLSKDELSDTDRKELEGLTTRSQQIEVEMRAAIIAEPEPQLETREMVHGMDAEQRERLQLRSQASLTNYLTRHMSGKLPQGRELELQQAAQVSDGIPIELWDSARSMGLETRADTVTGTPSTVGVNLDRIRPAVFAKSIAPMLGIEMPRVESGTFASATINASLSVAPQAKGGVAPSTAATFTVATTTPKRISARLSIAIEDIASVGTVNFESALRENLSLVLSDELDKQAINGNGTAPNLAGIFKRLTDPSAPAAGVVNWVGYASQHAKGVDGLWANTIKDVCVVVNPETYQLGAATFMGTDGAELSAAAYASMHTGGFYCNKRMPAKTSHVAQALLYRKGRSMLGGDMSMRTAVLPHWGQVSIDDIYSGSAQGERYVTFHVLLGDVILVQPDAYSQIAYRVSM